VWLCGKRRAYVQDRRISQTKYHCYVIESRYTQHGTCSLATSYNEAILGLPSRSLSAVN